MAGSPTSPLGAHFDDVPSSAYFSVATRWARAKGVTAGCTSTSFCPANNVTRSQFVVMLHRFAGSPNHGTSHGFSDVATSGEVAQAVTWGKKYEIVMGTTSTTFSLGNAVTRAQVARFLYRYANKPAAEGANRIQLGVTRPAQTF
ncbi:S-layer homology domain-containing protein [Nitriliruptor alkaliphilus]|uniref:S-layer homology domain-containing protein n=1 Tax=Nitriliruptor alkaliphilus TaxID=427918 RepID=UPI0012ECEB33|nr:S-layer homology domain-containing protein [Nitriliruptor alkaliphilus]